MLMPILIVEAGTISDAEAVPEPVSNVGCDNLEDSKEVSSDPKNTEQKQEDEGETFA